MSTFLITGARAPVALDLARNMARFGHTVYLADSWHFPIAKNTRAMQKYIKLPPARTQSKAYLKALKIAIRRYNIDYIIPTCEEVFYLSFFKKALENNCKLLAPDFEFIKKCHSKLAIMSLAQECSIQLPKTQELNEYNLHRSEHNFSDSVLKAEYGRFGSSVWCDLNKELVTNLINRHQNLLLQEKIKGKEYCTYSIAFEGRLQAHICYEPYYRLKDSASVYFKPLEHQKIKNFVEKFIAKHNITGQICFDIKESNNEIYLIECNPRANSGLHLLHNQDLAAALLGQCTLEPQNIRPAMLGYAMLLSCLPRAIYQKQFKTWLKDFKTAREVVYDDQDKSLIWPQILALGEWFYLAVRHLTNPRMVSTFDIEWNGEEIVR